MSPKSSRSSVKESDFVLIEENITQPLDHFAENSDTFKQRTFLFIPKSIASHIISDWRDEHNKNQYSLK